ncbi:MAG: XrtA/PEP-CTERM system histidine kinase PrsK [Deltaproteobacteria bacterium]
MIGIQNISAIAVVTLFVLFGAYMALQRRRLFSDAVLAMALVVTAVFLAFDSVAATWPDDFLVWKRLSLVTEALLPPLWLLFSLTFSRKVEGRYFGFLQWAFLAASPAFVVAALVVPVEGFFYSPDFAVEKILFLGQFGFVFYTALLGYMVVCAMNMEATLRMASGVERWKMKFEVLGAGTIMLTFALYYSQGLLYRVINMNLEPVRSVLLIAAASLMLYSRLTRGSGIKVYVSKDMAYRSAVVFFVGLYLIALGLMGEGMRYFGRTSRNELFIALAFLIGIVLVVVLMSEKVKRKIKVSIHKNFYTNKYDYRVQWLKFTDRLSEPGTEEDLLKAILAGFHEAFGMGTAALYLYERDRAVYSNISDHEMYAEKKDFAKSSELVSRLESTRLVYNVRDDAPGALEGPDARFLADKGVSFVVPLCSEGALDGFILLGKPLGVGEIYTYEDYDLMKTLAKQASATIMNRRLTQELSTAREMETIGKVSTFVMHDLKNHVSTLALISSNASECITDPEFQKDMLDSLSVTVAKMNRLISRLKNIEEKKSLKTRPVDLLAVVRDTASLVSSGNVRVEGVSAFALVDAEEMQKVVLNLVLNAIEATSGAGAVKVLVGCGENVFLSISDNGCGMSDEFQRRSLFKPFQSTKKKGLGIGLYQCKQIVEAHGGRIDVVSSPGKGTVFTVCLPPINAGTEKMAGIFSQGQASE